MKVKSLVSKQATDVYKALSAQDKALSAEQIAEALNITPNTIYRSVNQLLEVGIVTKSKTYPVKFRALPPVEALPWYLLNAQKLFKDSFGEPAKTTNSKSSKPAITMSGPR